MKSLYKVVQKNKGQSLLAVVAAMGGALVLVMGILQSNQFFRQNTQGTAESVRFNNLTTLLMSAIQGGLNKVSTQTYGCSAVLAYPANTLTFGACIDAVAYWPAYCRPTNQLKEADCTGPNVWTKSVLLQSGLRRDGLLIQNFKLCAPASGAFVVDLGSNLRVYSVLMDLVAQKEGEKSGSSRLNWQQNVFITAHSTTGVIQNCVAIAPSPTPVSEPTPNPIQTSPTPTPEPDGCAAAGWTAPASNCVKAGATYCYDYFLPRTAGTLTQDAEFNSPVVNFEIISSAGAGASSKGMFLGALYGGGGGGGSGAYLSGQFTQTLNHKSCLRFTYSCCGVGNASVDLYINADSTYRLGSLTNGADASTVDDSLPGGAGGGRVLGSCLENPYGTMNSCNMTDGVAGTATSSNDGGAGGSISGMGGCTSCGVGGLGGTAAGTAATAGSTYGGGGGGGAYYSGSNHPGAAGSSGRIRIWY